MTDDTVPEWNIGPWKSSMTQTNKLRKIADIERDWQVSSDFMRGHYATELIQAQRAEIEFLHMKIRELEEEVEFRRL